MEKDMKDMKKEIKELFKEFTAEDQEIITALSIFCKEGISLDVACDIIMPEDPRRFRYFIYSLSQNGWIYLDCQMLYMSEMIEEVAQKVCPVTDEKHIKMLTALQKHIDLKPLDDMYAKREYFKAARVYLTYLAVTWDDKGNEKPYELKGLFANNVICFARNAELSFTENRQRHFQLETRIDFLLLDYVLRLSAAYLRSDVYTLLGSLYNKIFRYNEAKVNFYFAESPVPKDESMLMMAESDMYSNLGIGWKALQMAYRAYEYNEKKGYRDRNLYVCLKIALMCAIHESPENADFWLDKFRDILGKRVIPQHHLFHIKLKETEALTHNGDASEKLRLLEEAEKETNTLYGTNSPEQAELSLVRSLINTYSKQYRKGTEDYRNYVDLNHYNYGLSKGDTAMLYSALITTHTYLRNPYTAVLYGDLLKMLDTNDASIAPGVRIEQAEAKFFAHMAEGEYENAQECIDQAREIYRKEVMINDETAIQQLEQVFCTGQVSEDMLGTDIERTINRLEYLFYIGQNNTTTAKEHLQKLIDTEANPLERLKWKTELGYVLALEQDREGAKEIWQEVVQKAEKKDIFSLCLDITNKAEENDMMYEASEFIDIALRFDNMVYADNNELAEALSAQARIQEYFGFNDSGEVWKDTERLLKSLNDRDGLSNFYFIWSGLQQDLEKERFIRKAIRLWEPEKGHFDERLSRMYHALTLALASVGKHKEAQNTARMAVELFPYDYPPEEREEIKEFL